MKSYLNYQIILSFLAVLSYSSQINAQFGKESYDYKKVEEFGLSEIQFVGAGDLQLSVYEGDDVAATTGLGALFWRIWPSSDYKSEDPE